MEGYSGQQEHERPSTPEMLQQLAQGFDDPATYPKMQSTDRPVGADGRLWYMAIDRHSGGLPILAPGTTRTGTLKVYSRQQPGDPDLTEITWTSADPATLRIQQGDGGERPLEQADVEWLAAVYDSIHDQGGNRQ